MNAVLEPESITEDELRAIIKDPVKRLCTLYKIIVKGDDEDDDGLVVRFSPNRAQRRLLKSLHNRNIICKARQLGFTTLACILWLDTALFAAEPMKCGIIAHNRESAEEIFRDKIAFAYDQLPDSLRAQFPAKKRTESQFVFAHNGSSIRVGTSMRSGTFHRLLVSEFGKICADSPKKAKEVVTGSIPTVPKSGLLIIESTAEGQDGKFYDMTMRANEIDEQGKELTFKDYRLHFYAWWMAPEYSLDPEGVVISESMQRYFNELIPIIGRELTPGQKAWYQATLDSDFAGEQPLMWQEYPSHLKEAFQVSLEGCYFATQMSKVRTDGRLTNIPVERVACNTFWDIGRGDMTCIWVHQRIGLENRFIRYHENSGEDLIAYATWLQSLGLVFDTHYLPHEADHKRMGETPDTNKSIKEMLEGLMPGQKFETVPRVTLKIQGIQAARAALGSCWFDEEHCIEGVKRLSSYRKKWNNVMGCWSDEAMHNEDSHGADAFMQFAQEVESGNKFPAGGGASFGRSGSGGFKRRGSPMAV